MTTEEKLLVAIAAVTNISKCTYCVACKELAESVLVILTTDMREHNEKIT